MVASRLNPTVVGFSRAEVRKIALAVQSWPDGATVDLVGSVEVPAIVVQPNDGGLDAPAFHLERTACDIVVSIVAGDEMTTLGQFDTLDVAICSLGSSKAQ